MQQEDRQGVDLSISKALSSPPRLLPGHDDDDANDDGKLCPCSRQRMLLKNVLKLPL